MKKATLGSTAVWAGAAVIIIGYQFANQIWPWASYRAVRQVVTWATLGITAASVGLMRDVDAKELLPSVSNTRSRNLLNIGNFLAAVAAGLSLGYLSGLFVSVQLHSPVFTLAAVLLVLGIGFQVCFALLTEPKV